MKTSVLFTALMLIFCIMKDCNGQFEDVVTKARKVCRRKAPVSQTILDQLANYVVPNDDMFKKYISCMYLHEGLLNTDGSCNLSAMKNAAFVFVGNHRYNHFMNQCCTNVPGDPIVTSWNLVECFMNNEEGVNFYYLFERYFRIP